MTAKLWNCLAGRFLDHIDRIVGVDRMVGTPIHALEVLLTGFLAPFKMGS